MPRGIYKRKPRGPTRWRVYTTPKIQRIITRIQRIQVKLNQIQKELSNASH